MSNTRTNTLPHSVHPRALARLAEDIFMYEMKALLALACVASEECYCVCAGSL